jgi:hypothetical protein
VPDRAGKLALSVLPQRSRPQEATISDVTS